MRSAPPTPRQALAVVARWLRALAGVPDYERYLEHVRRHHPRERPLSATEFARERLEARYSRPGSRCC